MNININGQSIIAFFRGKKTYLVAVAALVYGVGINHHFWPHEADIDFVLGTAGVATSRAALQKLIDALNGSPAAPATPANVTELPKA